MRLSEQRVHFSRLVGLLLAWADAHGYRLALGECYRPQVTADYYAAQGTGIANSYHCRGLAVDIVLYGPAWEYLVDSSEYAALGEYWESIGGTWGGRFERVDGGHFSLGET